MSEPRILNSPASGRGINQQSNPPKWGGGGSDLWVVSEVIMINRKDVVR